MGFADERTKGSIDIQGVLWLDLRRLLYNFGKKLLFNALLDLTTAELLTKFAIAPSGKGSNIGSVDGTQDTDGIAVTNANIDGHPKGLMVVQDGFNVDSAGSAANQNFKIVDWRDVEALFTDDETKR